MYALPGVAGVAQRDTALSTSAEGARAAKAANAARRRRTPPPTPGGRGPGPRAASCGHDGVRGGVEGLRHSTPPRCSLIIDHEKNKSAKNVRYWRTLGRQKYPGRLTEVRRPGILAEMPEFAVLASRQVRGSAPIPQPIEFYHIGRGESSVATSRQGRFFCAEKRERRG